MKLDAFVSGSEPYLMSKEMIFFKALNVFFITNVTFHCVCVPSNEIANTYFVSTNEASLNYIKVYAKPLSIIQFELHAYIMTIWAVIHTATLT